MKEQRSSGEFKKNSKEQSLIHVKIDYDEAVQSKKDLLSSERYFIMLLKTIKRYGLLRRDELNIKLRLQKKMKDLKINLGKLNETLPKIKLPDILKRDESEEEDSLKIKGKIANIDLESQLREIQDRLRRLG
jgi:hypothetical protein